MLSIGASKLTEAEGTFTIVVERDWRWMGGFRKDTTLEDIERERLALQKYYASDYTTFLINQIEIKPWDFDCYKWGMERLFNFTYNDWNYEFPEGYVKAPEDHFRKNFNGFADNKHGKGLTVCGRRGAFPWVDSSC